MMTVRMSKFYIWLAEQLPAKLCYFAANRVVVEATTGDFSHVVVPKLRAMTALETFAKINKLEL
jgi:hypothetical protein